MARRSIVAVRKPGKPANSSHLAGPVQSEGGGCGYIIAGCTKSTGLERQRCKLSRHLITATATRAPDDKAWLQWIGKHKIVFPRG